MRLGLALIVAAALLAPGSAWAQAPRPLEDPRSVAERVRARGEYGDELTFEEAGGGTGRFGGGHGAGAGADPLGERPRPRAGRDGLGELSDRPSARYERHDPPPRVSWPQLSLPHLPADLLMWVGGAFLVALLLILGYFGVKAWLERGPGAALAAGPDALGDPPPPGSEGDAPLPLDLGDPDALAAAGRWSEAVLALLVESLKLVGWQPERQRSLTAREVLGGLGATDARRGPLGEVVFGSERVRFAGVPADQATFDALRPWWVGLRDESRARTTQGPQPQGRQPQGPQGARA